jgi:hypothetical protein
MRARRRKRQLLATERQAYDIIFHRLDDSRPSIRRYASAVTRNNINIGEGEMRVSQTSTLERVAKLLTCFVRRNRYLRYKTYKERFALVQSENEQTVVDIGHPYELRSRFSCDRLGVE